MYSWYIKPKPTKYRNVLDARLATKSKRVDQLTVTVNVVLTKVSQEVTTATDFLHQTTVSSVVFFMLFDVFVKVVDFPSKDSNLNLY